MTKAWKRLDLGGGGLQSVNLTLSRAMRKRSIAYAWWLLFPVGAHRLYLFDRAGFLGQTALSAIALVALVVLGAQVAGTVALVLAVWALYDLFWIDRRVTTENKKLRMRVYLQADSPPPKNLRGRFNAEDAEATLAEYTRIKELERSGYATDDRASAQSETHLPSLQEQETMIRELARRRRKGGRS
jgi:hypothetical protein